MLNKIFLDSASIATGDLAGLFERFGYANNNPQILSITTIGNAWEPFETLEKGRFTNLAKFAIFSESGYSS